MSQILSVLNRPRIKAFLTATFLMGTSNGIFDAVYNFYLVGRGVEESHLGLIYGVATAIMGLAVFPALWLNRRVRKERLLLAAALIYALPFLTLPFVTGPVAAAAVLSLVLAGMLGMLSVGNAIASEDVPAAERTYLFSWFFVLYLGGGFVAGILVATTLQPLRAMTADPYRALLLGAAGLALLMLAARTASVAKRNNASEAASAQTPGMVTNCDKRAICRITVIGLLLGGSMALFFRFTNLLFEQALGISPEAIAVVLSTDKLVSLVGALAAPLLVTKVPQRISFLVAGAVASLALVLQGLGPGLLMFVVFYLVRLLLNYFQMPILDSAAVSVVSRPAVMASSGMRQASFYTGGAFSAVLYGWLLNHQMWDVALFAAAGMVLLGSVVMHGLPPAPSDSLQSSKR